MMTKYSGSLGHYEWNIEELGLNLIFFDIKESYANGIVKEEKLKWRRHWTNIENEINVITQGKNDSDKFSLRPLEIRSFRIKVKGPIQVKTPSRKTGNNVVLAQINNAQPSSRLRFRKRCF